MNKIRRQHCRNCAYCKVSKGTSSRIYQCRWTGELRRVLGNGMCHKYKEAYVK